MQAAATTDPPSASTEPRKSLSPAIFFPSPERSGGILWLRGWVYAQSGGHGATAEASVTAHAPGTEPSHSPVDIERPDVRKVEPDAPTRCGFEVFLEVAASPKPDDRVLLTFASHGSEGAAIPIGHVPIHNIEDVFSRQIGKSGLSALKLSKIRNLIENERERLNKASILRAKPIYLFVDPCFSCQLSCPHCSSHRARTDGAKMRNMTMGMFDRIVEAYGETLIQMNLFNWGEPLLNPLFPSFVERAHASGIYTLTNTNLSMPLTSEFISRLVASGLDEIIMSIDGATQETYERYRVGGRLDLVLDNIRRVTETKRGLGRETPRLRWQYLLFPWNRDELSDARKLAEEMGVDEFFTLPGDVSSGRLPPVQRPSRSPTPVARETMEQWRSLQADKRAHGRHFGCDLLYQQMTINAEGAIHPCCYVLSPAHSFGNLDLLDAADNALNSQRHVASRRMLRDCAAPHIKGFDPCSGCPVLTNERFSGHVTGMSFQSAFWRITGRSLRSYLGY